jgi:hypothetical protein
MKTFIEFITEARVGVYSDEHALARIWNHMTGASGHLKKSIAHDKGAMMREFAQAKINNTHPLHFRNAAEGFVGGTKTLAHRTSYHAEHKNAIHSIHALATYPDFAKAVKEKHIARVMGNDRGEVSDIWKKHGATNATSKSDVAIKKPNSKRGTGIRLSMKKGVGSQLMSAGPEETAAVHDHAAREMLSEHPDYTKLPNKKKEAIHVTIMSKVKLAGKHADAMRTSPSRVHQHELLIKAQRAIDSVHNDHPSLNHYVRKEAATGRGKFGKNSPHAASYVVTSATKKNAAVVKHVDQIDYNGPSVRAALPKGGFTPGKNRSGNFKADQRGGV